MAYRIQFRRDTAANWTSTDPILAEGEFGLETDTKKVKIGDGVTAWTLLDYFAGGMLVHDNTYHDPDFLTEEDALDKVNSIPPNGFAKVENIYLEEAEGELVIIT